MAHLTVVGRMQCAPGKTSRPLYVTLFNDSKGETVNLMAAQSDKQSWCFVTHSDLGSNFLIASYPVADRVLMATTESMPDYGSAYRTRVIHLDTPIQEGGPLPGGDITSKYCQFCIEKINSNCYYVRNASGIYSPTILQGGFGPGSSASDPPREGTNVTIHSRENLPREWFSFENEPLFSMK